MAGGSILKMILKENKNNPKALKAINEILNKAKDDSNVKKEKLKTGTQKIQTKKVAKDDSEITEAKIQQKRKEVVQEKLDAWAKDNVPEEGWGSTDKKYKEIKLRKKFLKEKSGVSWVEYLGSNGLKIVREVSKNSKKANVVSQPKRRAKDNSEVLEMKRSKMNDDILPVIEKVKLQKKAKDTSDLFLMAKKLQNVNVKRLKGEEISQCAKDIRSFFKTAKSKLKSSDSIAKSLEVMIKTLNIPENVDENSKVPTDIANLAISAVKQVRKIFESEVKKL
jgi:hypothetical protein